MLTGVILSEAKNLSTGCTLAFQAIARPFATLRVTTIQQ